MKRIIFTTIISLFIAMGSFAEIHTGSCGANLTWTLDTETGVLTISGEGDMDNYGYEGAPWFNYRSDITSVEIQDDVASIGNYAFRNCSNIASITIPDAVTRIGSSAFSSCSNLTSITIGSAVTSIGDYAFYGCGSLTDIDVDANSTAYSSEAGVLYNFDKTTLITYPMGKTETTFSIPSTVTRIGIFAFENCDNLTSVTIPDAVTSIGGYAFYSCDSLTSVTIPNAVTSIEDMVFEFCGSLTAIDVDANNTAFSSETGVLYNFDKTTLIKYPIGKTENTFSIPSTVSSIGSHAFYSCRNLTSVTIPDAVTSIGSYAFGYCGFRSITIPDAAKSIGYYAFINCWLDSVTIPDAVTSIGSNAFNACYWLKSITIGSAVTNIGSGAFSGCNSLTSIVSKAVVPPTLVGNVFYNVDKDIPLHIPQGSATAYQAAAGWNEFTNIQDDLITVTMSFNSNGGSNVESVRIVQGCIITAPAPPTKDGFVFSGWFKNEALTNEWNFATDVVSANITLYAAWTETVGIKNNALSAGVYPNGNGTFTIDVAGNETFNVTVINMQGQVVKRETIQGGSHTISIGNQPAGVYMFVVDNGKHKTTVKGVKR